MFFPSLPPWWPYAAGSLIGAVSLVASAHVVVRKRDVRAAIAWVGLIWLVPGLGVFLYALLGLNRIRRRANVLHRNRRRLLLSTPGALRIARAGTASSVPDDLLPQARLGEQISGRPLLTRNHVDILQNGDEAYPAMLKAIRGAKDSVALASFIFGDDQAGRPFVEELAAAQVRGIQVRVLVDGVGVRYTLPPVHKALRRRGVRAELFLPRFAQAGLAFFNLRNHRKMLTVDGRIAFVGGMNIQARNIHADHPPRMVRDVHFRVAGPIVGQVQEAFAEDWAFTTNEILDGPAWFPSLEDAGNTTARVITDGPDGDLETIRTVLLGALSSAQHSVRIVTPYFLPDQAMIAALSVAALRGVRVEIVLPEKVNIPMVQWAAAAQLWQVLRPGCRVYLTPLPFDHTKLMVVDGRWSLFGSTNWDPRSLRLNFELDVESYCTELSGRLNALVDSRIALAREITLADIDARRLPIKLRDGVARLFSPYL
ncbi:MAG: phospholipase D-like domain-containing protein [Gemmatimonadota bacterium]|nr:phospholipase D-like domain-containing protein [Gemmatimonadota bacterium]